MRSCDIVRLNFSLSFHFCRYTELKYIIIQIVHKNTKYYYTSIDSGLKNCGQIVLLFKIRLYFSMLRTDLDITVVTPQLAVTCTKHPVTMKYLIQNIYRVTDEKIKNLFDRFLQRFDSITTVITDM